MILGKTSITTFSGDITKLSFVDAIVNTTNNKLGGDQGISKKIHKAAGHKLAEACKKLAVCETGEAKITDAYNLPCKKIIHTASPKWKGGKDNEAKTLAECYRNILQTAMENDVHSIAFPSISTGFHGFPKTKAANTAVHTVFSFIAKNPDYFIKIIWVVNGTSLKAVYDKEIDNLSPEIYKNMVKSLSKTKPGSIHEITMQDFVVHKTNFKCMKLGHKVTTIDGVLKVADKSGKIKTVKIPAGYCSDCKVYFILESTYKSLQTKGIPMCKVTSESNYYEVKKALPGGMKLASESILKLYGYSVSEAEDIPTIQRWKILSSLIDNGVMKKSFIISYLDFFINSKKKIPKYANAVAKWKVDRSFIESYKLGTFEEVIIKSIHKKGGL